MLLSFATATFLVGTFAHATAPLVCRDGARSDSSERAPGALTNYFDSIGNRPFDLRRVCQLWAAGFSERNRARADDSIEGEPVPARFILFPSTISDQRQVVSWLLHSGHVSSVEVARAFVVASFSPRATKERLREVLDAPMIGYVEPDCDGPDFLATSGNLPTATVRGMSCWMLAARDTFPNDPCMKELWGHDKIGWNSAIAARSLPRTVAILDSGIDAGHEDLARNVMRINLKEPARSQGHKLNARCATSGRCYPHGTQMAGTIGGRMDNGLGVAGVAPNSRLLPIVISQVDSGQLARLSTIAGAIDAAARSGADIINISAKWPVDSRAIAEALRRAVGEDGSRRRLLVTGYATSLDLDDSVREYFPSQYRCLPGVIAAVPTDMRGHDLFNPDAHPNADDGRIQAPGVDIVVTTTENSERGYALAESAGASSAAAYVSGVVALVWGSPPLDRCNAQEIKRLLFCRSKSSTTSRYPWINVDFLRELERIGSDASCLTAMEALGCD